MAYVPRDDEEQQQQEGGSQPGFLGGGRQSSGPSRSSFVNVTDYLTKNPNEGENLVNRVVGNLESEKAGVQSDITKAGEQFGQRVNSGKMDLDENFLKSALERPEEFVQSDDNVARFEAMKNAAYKGPQSFEETDLFAPVQSKVQALKTKGESIGTEAGRNAVLSPLSERPTAGKTALNQMILQGTPDAAGKLSAAAGTFPAVEEQWNQVRQGAAPKVAGAKAATEATKKTTNERLTASTDKFKGDLQGKVNSATNERNAFNTDYEAILASLSDKGGLDLRPEQLEKLGLKDAYPYLSKLQSFNDSRGLAYYNQKVPLSGYVVGGNAATNTPEAGSVASAQDYAREAALQKLSGMDLGLPDQMTGSPYQMNGQMPNVDYMGAFRSAGERLKGLDASWRPSAAGYSVDDVAQLQAIQSRRGISSGTPNDSYYNDPQAGAAPLPDISVAPPPAGWNPAQPAPYPQPTSAAPSNLVNPRWNPYSGQWEGAQLQPGNPPPAGGGGGRATF